MDAHTPELHGLADAHYRPERADWTVDQRWERYSAQEHATWKTLYERQTRLLPGRACAAFAQGMQALPISFLMRSDEVSPMRTLWLRRM